ncbi:hypothetical protein [Plantactinospora sp. CA-290183]|uniref:hypothetical protein n=1 Tax=Plantactinospora sp. CA-290183 TaxID=3240006 RepID=UPI003D902ADB
MTIIASAPVPNEHRNLPAQRTPNAAPASTQIELGRKAWNMLDQKRPVPVVADDLNVTTDQMLDAIVAMLRADALAKLERPVCALVPWCTVKHTADDRNVHDRRVLRLTAVAGDDFYETRLLVIYLEMLGQSKSRLRAPSVAFSIQEAGGEQVWLKFSLVQAEQVADMLTEGARLARLDGGRSEHCSVLPWCTRDDHNPAEILDDCHRNELLDWDNVRAGDVTGERRFIEMAVQAAGSPGNFGDEPPSVYVYAGDNAPDGHRDSVTFNPDEADQVAAALTECIRLAKADA